MNARMIKNLNENLPDPIKRMLSGIIQKKLTQNKVFLQQYNQLLEFDSLSESHQQEQQREMLERQLCYAYQHTTKYRALFDEAGYDVNKPFNKEAFEKIPIQMKNDIKSTPADFISMEKVDYYTGSTGGTSGIPLSLWMSRESIFKERAFIYHFWQQLGYDYNVSKLITFRGTGGNSYYRYNPVFNEMILSSRFVNRDHLDRYLSVINDVKPDFFQGYPSAIKNLCRLLREENRKLEFTLKGVFFISEEVSDRDREFIEETLNCKSMAFYGHSERAVFAEEVKPGRYQFHPLYGYTELIPTNKEGEYRIIATGFLNKKMPLIRYDTDDIAIANEEGFIIRGSTYRQHIVGKNGEIMMMRSKLFYSEVFTVFTKYQFVQHKPGHVDIMILDKGKEEEKKMLGTFLEEQLGGVFEFSIKECDELELTSRGKEKFLVQNSKDL